ncbi:hypothetical protein [Brachyspira sp.]|uniref:hypothetical protein n=1 Tax=Brachyspira sp. TaxID=1977261 RepID=UPI002637CF18|nr:hypothetical protein [Brachyspira sp.]
MNNKLKIIKYRAVLFFIAIIFLSASFIIISINLRFNNDNIIKINANIESINYYEYGIVKKQKFANVVYSFIYEDEKIIVTNSYLEDENNNLQLNSKTEIFYDKTSNAVVVKPSKYTLVLAFIFIFFAIAVIVFAFKLKANNIYVSQKLYK